MFRERYHQLNEQISPSAERISKVLSSGNERGKKKRHAHLRKPMVALAVLSLCLVTVPVLAATSPSIYELMYSVSPSIAQFFMPVQQSCEDNGIRMEVISAYIHDDTAEIYVTMQDLEGERVDATTDLYDSYSIHRPFSSAATCQCVGYDEATKTATFLISITEFGNQKITGDKITFSVREFLSHKATYEDITIPLDLSSVPEDSKTQAVDSSGGGGEFKKYVKDWSAMALIPSAPMEQFPVKGIDLTGIGYIGGMLHVQTAVSNALQNDNHGFFYLKDASGQVVESAYNFYFVNQQEGPGRVDYCEYVFDISDASAYTLYGDFVTSGLRTEGTWQVTFPLAQK